MNEKEMPVIIFDTDMETDCDDAGALAIAIEYAKAGKAKLLGIVTDAISEYSAPCCEAICNYYDFKVPIGTVHESCYPDEETNRYTRYRGGLRNFEARGRRYSREYAKILGKRDVDYPAAEIVYRRLLAEAEDKSVTVLCVGFLTALARLFLTEGDEISPLSGLELFEKKVIKVVSMGHAERPVLEKISTNHKTDAIGTEQFFAKCPVPVHVSGTGIKVMSGASFSETLPVGHPLRHIYEIYLTNPSGGRMSWDQIATLYVLDPDSSSKLCEDFAGTLSFSADPLDIVWNEGGTRRDCWVYPIVSDEELSAWVDKRMLGDLT